MNASHYEQRARELMLPPDEKRAYLRLMLTGARSEYQIQCPACHVWIETYESHTVHHARTCAELKAEDR